MDFKQKIALLMVLASVQLPCASQAAEEDRELAQIAAEQRRSGQDEQLGEINSALTDSLSTKPTQETDREVRERKRKLKQTRKEKEKINERRLRESANHKPTPTKPETITIAPNEPEVTPAPRPVVRPTPPRPVVQPTPTQPVVQPTPTQPVAQPAPAQPVVQPTPTQPVAQPTPTQPVAQPTPAQPVAQPAPAQPVAQPTPTQPVAQPTPTQPVTRPTPAQTVAQPTPAQPVARPTPAQPVTRPTPTQPVTRPTPTPQQDLIPTPKPVETLNLPNQKVIYANFVEVAKAVNFIPLYMSRKSGYDITAMYAGQGIVEIRYGRRWEPTVSLAVRTYKRAAGEEPQDISGVTGVKWRVDTTTGTTIYIAKISDTQQVAAWAVGQYTFSAQAENLSFATFHALVADELVELSTHYYLDL